MKDWFHIGVTIMLGILLAVNFARDCQTQKNLSNVVDNSITQVRNVDQLLEVTNGIVRILKNNGLR